MVAHGRRHAAGSDDLAAAELTFEAHLTGGTKDTAHRATRLRGNTQRAAILCAAQILAVWRGRRDLRIIRRLGQPVDHPVHLHFPESEYLKGLLLQAD